MNSMKTKQKSSTNLPGAWVCSPNNKGRKSIKNGNIYLDDNEEFVIELYNPLKECVLSDIRLNGQSIAETGLVLKPGQRIYLDCFVDDRKKFTFKTYEVEGTVDNIEAIQNNGSMEVFFYKEGVVSIKNWPERFRGNVIREYYPVYYPHYYPVYPVYPSWPYGSITTYSGAGCITNSNSIGSSNSIIGSTNTGTTYTSLNSSNCSYTSGVIGQSVDNFELNDNQSFPPQSGIETGRIEKGEKSDQKFVDVDMDFEKNYIHSIVYKLLPNSRKPIEFNSSNGELFINGNKQEAFEKQYIVEKKNIIELLKGLGELRDSEVITKGEFEEKKKELLSKI